MILAQSYGNVCSLREYGPNAKYKYLCNSQCHLLLLPQILFEIRQVINHKNIYKNLNSCPKFNYHMSQGVMSAVGWRASKTGLK